MTEPFEEVENKVARIARMEAWVEEGEITAAVAAALDEQNEWVVPSEYLTMVRVGQMNFVEPSAQYPSEFMVAQVALAIGSGMGHATELRARVGKLLDEAPRQKRNWLRGKISK